MITSTYYRFAQAYSEGAYNNCTYNCVEGQATGATSSPGNGALADTGVVVVGVVTLACIIALVAILVRIWRRPNTPLPQEVPIAEPPEEREPTRN